MPARITCVHIDCLEICSPSSCEQFFFFLRLYLSRNIIYRYQYTTGKSTLLRAKRQTAFSGTLVGTRGAPTRPLPNDVVLLWYAIHDTTHEKETGQKQRTVNNFSYCIIMRDFAGRGHGHRRRRRWTVDRRNTLSPHQRPFPFFPRSIFAQNINNNFLVHPGFISPPVYEGVGDNMKYYS